MREFKIFTNVHSTVVGPKNFDEESFLGIEGDVRVIPRNVLSICLGKSRCVPQAPIPAAPTSSSRCAQR